MCLGATAAYRRIAPMRKRSLLAVEAGNTVEHATIRSYGLR